MSEMEESIAGEKSRGTDAHDKSHDVQVYPGARRLWAGWSPLGGKDDREADLDVTQALSSRFGTTYTRLAVRVLDTVIRALETSGRKVTEADVTHHVLLRDDHLLDAVLNRWLVANHDEQENWEHELKSNISQKDPRRVTAMAAIYRKLVDNGNKPYELADWLILVSEIPRDDYAMVATVAADILAFFGGDARLARSHPAA